MISTIVLLAILILGGIFYFLKTRNQLKLPTFPTKSPTDQSTQPTATPQATGGLIKSNQIRTSDVQLTYPGGWLPVFSDPKTGKSLIYFAATEEEAKSLASCAAQGSCSNYSFKLEDFTDLGVWQNYTIEDSIKQVKPEIQLSQLQKTTLGGREAWSGYTSSNKLTHQLVIDTSTQQSKSLVAITATATENGRQMMEQYVSLLPSLVVREYKSLEPSELATKNSFVMELDSSLTTQDYLLLSFILNSLLAPQNSTENYSYFLYTESTKSTGSTVGGPNYPTDSYLDSKYYLLTDNNRLQSGMYGTPQVKIKLSNPATSNFGAYLADPKYCQQDSDCQYRANFCTIGAFNPYHQFYSPWGCGPPDYEGLGNSEMLISNLDCQSGVKVDYDAIRCVNNSCQAINPQPVCNP